MACHTGVSPIRPQASVAAQSSRMQHTTRHITHINSGSLCLLLGVKVALEPSVCELQKMPEERGLRASLVRDTHSHRKPPWQHTVRLTVHRGACPALIIEVRRAGGRCASAAATPACMVAGKQCCCDVLHAQRTGGRLAACAQVGEQRHQACLDLWGGVLGAGQAGIDMAHRLARRTNTRNSCGMGHKARSHQAAACKRLNS